MAKARQSVRHARSASGFPKGASLPVSPSLDFVIDQSRALSPRPLVDLRVLRICLMVLCLGVATAFVAVALTSLIAMVTNLAYFGRMSVAPASPASAVRQNGLLTLPVPIVGALVVGLMARYGSRAIRGHGIPEAMEQVLTNGSRIPFRVMFLKPLSSAIAIGTGGPFGAEGPIIATGGALGSTVGQLLSCTAAERKVLLASGAAAGMAAIFGSPISAVLLAIELLLFEYRPRSVIPVALAATMATGVRISIEGAEPFFPIPELHPPTLMALLFYLVLGGIMGLIAAVVTKLVYGIEDAFEKLPIHWMWWPAAGAVVVGIVGYFAPDTLGVGYDNITGILTGDFPFRAVGFLCLMKLISWSVALGSGTSGGTLAPMFTIGGGCGLLIGGSAALFLPGLGIDLRMAALVGMATIFAGASRAMLASAVFAFETTLQPAGLPPLLGSCAVAHLVSCLLMKNTIMTEKIARRGIRAPVNYTADPLEQILVSEIASTQVVSLRNSDEIGKVREWIQSGGSGSTHQGFPVLDAEETLIGVVTRRDILSADTSQRTVMHLIRTAPIFVCDNSTARDAANQMVVHSIGRLPVVKQNSSQRVVGMISRSDLLRAYRHRIQEEVVY